MESLLAFVVLVVILVPVVLILTLIGMRNAMTRGFDDLKGQLSEIRVMLGERGSRSVPASPAASTSPSAAQSATVVRTPEPEPVVPPAPMAVAPEPAQPVVSNTQPSVVEQPALARATAPSPLVAESAAPVPPPQAPRVTSDSEEAPGIVRRMWNWLLYGDERPPVGKSKEYAIGSTWLMRIGIVLVLVGVGYLLKEVHGLMGPAGRVALVLAFGIGLTFAGTRLVGGAYRILGHGFVGGGIAVLYGGLYAAGPHYELVPIWLSFLLMTLVTISSGVLSLWLNSQITAILGIVGGYATPIMLSTGEPQLAILYGYTLLLGCGVLLIAHTRQWRMLNYLAFVFSWALFFSATGEYKPERDFALTMTFLVLLFCLHSAIVYYYNVRRRMASTVLEVLHLLANVVMFSASSYHLILERAGRPWPAVMAVAVAAFYIAHVYVFFRQRMADQRLLTVFVGVAGFFTVWAVPLIFERETLTIFWALQALLFVWLSYRLNSRVFSAMANIMYLIVMYRVTVLDIPRSFELSDWSQQPFKAYLASLIDRLPTFVVVIASLFAAFRLHVRPLRPISQNIPGTVEPRAVGNALRMAGHATYWCAVGFLFVVLYLELTGLTSYYRPVQAPVLTGLLAALGVFFAYHFRASGTRLLLLLSAVTLVVASLKLLAVDGDMWALQLWVMVYEPAPVGFLMRFVDWAFVVLAVATFVRLIAGQAGMVLYTRVFKVLGIAIVFTYVTLEISTFCNGYLRGFQAGAVSLAWAAFAAAFLARGFKRSSRAYRYAGLVLFLIVAAKVFMIDLADMPIVFRVLGAVLAGAFLVLGSFIYLRGSRGEEGKGGSTSGGGASAAGLLLVACVIACSAVPSDAARARPDDFPRVRTIEPSGIGPRAAIGAVRMDSLMFRGASDDYSSMRLYDGKGSEVPFLVRPVTGADTVLLERTVSVRMSKLFEPAGNRLVFEHEIVNREQGAPDAVDILTRNSDFEKQVIVSGSDNGKSWVALCAPTAIFDYRRFTNFRSTKVRFKSRPYRYCRVEITNVAQEQTSPFRQIVKRSGDVGYEEYQTFVRHTSVLRVEQLAFTRQQRSIRDSSARVDTIPLPIAASEIDSQHRTTVVLLGSNREPVKSLIFDFPTENFSRGLSVEGSVDSTGDDSWWALGSGEVRSVKTEGFSAAWREIELTPGSRYRRYRVTISNFDNPPLEIRGVRAIVEQRELIFFHRDNASLALRYGSDSANVPVYDVAQVLAVAPRAQCQTWKAGPESVSDVRNPSWTMPSKAILVAVLLCIVAGLGYLLLVTVRKVQPGAGDSQ